MRLRRETGDFQIKVVNAIRDNEDVVIINPIRPGLAAEDLIGQIVKIENDSSDGPDTYALVIAATSILGPGDPSDEDGPAAVLTDYILFEMIDLSLTLQKLSLFYNKRTGEITDTDPFV